MMRSAPAASSLYLVLGILLTACVPPQSVSQRSDPVVTQPQQQVSAAKPASHPAPKPKTKTKRKVEPTPAPMPKASSLIGRNVTTTRNLLGKPLMVRRERGAALWLYSAGRCNVHILTTATNMGEIVRDLQFRDSKTQRSFGADSDAGRYCFQQIVEAKKD